MAAWLYPYKPYRVFQEVKVRPDAAVWNALIAAAGRAGQLQRAFEALQDMQVQPRLYCDSNTLRASYAVFGWVSVHLACIMNIACVVSECSLDSNTARLSCIDAYTGTDKNRGVYAFQQS